MWLINTLQDPIMPRAEMEYCSIAAASMLAEEIWQIAEGFVEVPANL